jgi:hypothetical protein
MNIEELAFKNYYELINIQKIDLLLIIEFLQKDRKQWIDQFTQTHNESVEIQKENKQLKEEKRKVRDYINKHCVNEKISKEVGYKCYTMADTNELEKIMKILGDDK